MQSHKAIVIYDMTHYMTTIAIHCNTYGIATCKIVFIGKMLKLAIRL